MKKYIQTYVFTYKEPKSGNPRKKAYTGKGFTPNGALISAIKKFRSENRFLFSSHKILEIAYMNGKIE